MAIYHLEAKIVSRGTGRSACAASAYLSCSAIHNEYDGVQHDYTRKGGLVWEKVFLPEGLTELGDFAFNNCTGLNYIVIPTTLKKTGFNALTAGMLVLPPRSPLAASYRKDRYIYWDGKEPVEQLEERIAACKLKQKKHSRLVLCVVGLFFLFGFTMMAGLLLKIPRVLTVGWIGTAAFGIVIALMIRQDNQKNR